MQTPWGPTDNIESVCDGLAFVDTAGHGGIKVSDALNEQIPLWIKEATYHRLGVNGWYEEDCDWCIPVIIFSAEFHVWAERADSTAYINKAEKCFKKHILPDLLKNRSLSKQVVAFCKKYRICNEMAWLL